MAERLEDRLLLTAVIADAVDPAAEPTIYDQYLLELINRGRLDPLAEATRYKIDLNEGLAAGTISAEPKQPLAFSPALIAAARGHSDWMLATDHFDHTGEGGSSPGDRMVDAGYTFRSPGGWGENIAWIGNFSPVDLTQYTADIHSNLFHSPGHRVNQMNAFYREVGLGVIQGPPAPSGFTWVDIYATENFARSGNTMFLTGVVYEDGAVSADAFYTPGEGQGGVSIQATRDSDGQVFSTTTWTAGGYTLPLPSGTYTVRATGEALGGSIVRQGVVVSSQNVKVDFATRAHVDLGQIDYRAVADLNLDAALLPFRIETTRAGTLTLLASDANAGLTLYDDTWIQVAQASGRLDYETPSPATVYYAGLSGQGQVNLLLANLVRHDGGCVVAYGTGGDDTFIFDASSPDRQLSINDISYRFAEPHDFYFDGLGGQNHAEFRGSAGADRAMLRPAQAALIGQGYTVAAANVASSDFDGGGGQDVAVLHGSRGANVLTAGGQSALANPQRATLAGDQVSIAATAESLLVNGRGSKNTANLFDSPGEDLFQPFWKDARMSGPGYSRVVRGFHDITTEAVPITAAQPQADFYEELAPILGLAEWSETRSQKDTTLTIVPVDQVFAYWD